MDPLPLRNGNNPFAGAASSASSELLFASPHINAQSGGVFDEATIAVQFEETRPIARSSQPALRSSYAVPPPCTRTPQNIFMDNASESPFCGLLHT